MPIRKNVNNLSDQELEELREAFSLVQARSDDKSYEHFAGLHGLPLPSHCRHDDRLFLAWHRAYLYHFELALQDRVPGVALPWWDWVSDFSHQNGLPEAYTVERVGGQDNPLHSVTVRWPQELIDRILARPSLRGIISPDGRTLRDPDHPDGLPRRSTIDDILINSGVFMDFSRKINNVHGAVHVWVRGTMSNPIGAAYDPIFWAHHCMVDRLWHLWQMRHSSVTLPDSFLDTVLEPFNMTFRETLDIEKLGYEYAVHTV